MIGNLTLTESYDELWFFDLVKSDISFVVDHMKDGRVLLDEIKLPDLESYINFTQIRIYCTKPWHGRTFDMASRNNGSGEQFKKYIYHEIDEWIPAVSSGECMFWVGKHFTYKEEHLI